MLCVRSAVGVGTPGAALVVEVGRERFDLADSLGRLQELNGETLVRVPCNVAVLWITLVRVLDGNESCCAYHHPGTGVVSLESKRQPAVGRQHGGVSAGRVVVVEGVDVALPPGLLTGTEDVEVVAVQVCW